jgi:hypothetical protein
MRYATWLLAQVTTTIKSSTFRVLPKSDARFIALGKRPTGNI